MNSMIIYAIQFNKHYMLNKNAQMEKNPTEKKDDKKINRKPNLIL